MDENKQRYQMCVFFFFCHWETRDKVRRHNRGSMDGVLEIDTFLESGFFCHDGVYPGFFVLVFLGFEMTSCSCFWFFFCLSLITHLGRLLRRSVFFRTLVSFVVFQFLISFHLIVSVFASIRLCYLHGLEKQIGSVAIYLLQRLCDFAQAFNFVYSIAGPTNSLVGRLFTTDL